jgi:hypothetical protein
MARRHRVERGQQRRVGLRGGQVDRRDDVVRVLQLLVVLQHDELVAGHGAQASPEALPPLASAPPVPEEPDSPQAVRRTPATARGRSMRARLRLWPAF